MSELTKMAQLIAILNELEVQAFSNERKNQAGETYHRVSVSAVGSEGRQFVNRDKIGLNDDGTPKWGWVAGKAMRPKNDSN